MQSASVADVLVFGIRCLVPAFTILNGMPEKAGTHGDLRAMRLPVVGPRLRGDDAEIG